MEAGEAQEKFNQLKLEEELAEVKRTFELYKSKINRGKDQDKFGAIDARIKQLEYGIAAGTVIHEQVKQLHDDLARLMVTHTGLALHSARAYGLIIGGGICALLISMSAQDYTLLFWYFVIVVGLSFFLFWRR
jgi:hypothetical protein